MWYCIPHGRTSHNFNYNRLPVNEPLPPHDTVMQIFSVCSVLLSCWLVLLFLWSIRGHISSLRMMNTLTLLLVALSLSCEFSCFLLFYLLSDNINWWSVSDTRKLPRWLFVSLSSVVHLSFHLIRLYRSEYGVHSFQFSGEKAWWDSQSLLQGIWLHIYLLYYALDQTTCRKSTRMDRGRLVHC